MFHTLNVLADYAARVPDGVVIPWRGFRCFTPAAIETDVRSASVGVVIPWRGFRCFTLNVFEFGAKCDVNTRCSPLAGI